MLETQEMWVRSLGREISWRRKWQPSILAWKIPWTEEPGRLQFMGSQSRTQLSMHTQACCGYLEPQEKHITSTGSILFTS